LSDRALGDSETGKILGLKLRPSEQWTDFVENLKMERAAEKSRRGNIFESAVIPAANHSTENITKIDSIGLCMALSGNLSLKWQEIGPISERLSVLTDDRILSVPVLWNRQGDAKVKNSHGTKGGFGHSIWYGIVMVKRYPAEIEKTDKKGCTSAFFGSPLQAISALIRSIE
jgi:hypothetical protein